MLDSDTDPLLDVCGPASLLQNLKKCRMGDERFVNADFIVSCYETMTNTVDPQTGPPPSPVDFVNFYVGIRQRD